MYLNADVPKLTSEGGIAAFCRGYLGHRLASTKPAGVLTRAFVKSIEAFLQREGRELVRFQKGQRKDALLQQKRRRFKKPEGVLFVGVAQEKVRVPRTPRKACPGGGTLPWSIYATALVNVYYCYCRDQAFGPFFLKFCSSFPYSAKLGLNGQEYLKCQLAQRGMAFQALDNGRLACADLPVAQRISDELSDTQIQALFRKGLARLPHPYSAQDRRAGYRYDWSVLQAEFSLTQVWDPALQGRCFFEEVLRENIDWGRPEQGQLILARKRPRKTAPDGRCRTRIITQGVVPSCTCLSAGSSEPSRDRPTVDPLVQKVPLPRRWIDPQNDDQKLQTPCLWATTKSRTRCGLGMPSMHSVPSMLAAVENVRLPMPTNLASIPWSISIDRTSLMKNSR